MAINNFILAGIQKTGANANKTAAILAQAKARAAQTLAKALTSGNSEVEVSASDLAEINAIGKLSARMAAVEQELRSIYADAMKLASGVSAPKSAGKTKVAEGKSELEVALAKVKPLKATKGKRLKATKVRFAGNTAKLMTALESHLDTKQYQFIKQSEVAKEAGIPLGSITASLKRLVALEKIDTNHHGGYRLHVQAATSVEAPAAEIAVSKPAKAKPARAATKPAKATKAVKAAKAAKVVKKEVVAKPVAKKADTKVVAQAEVPVTTA